MTNNVPGENKLLGKNKVSNYCNGILKFVADVSTTPGPITKSTSKY